MILSLREMKRIIIKAGHGSKIKIVKRGGRYEKIAAPEYEVGKNTLFLTSHFINFAEIRAESSFRPQQEDIEVIYALSGIEHNIPDTFHKLSSRFTIKEASHTMILANTKEIVNHIIKEREEEPNLIVLVHTHPAGIAHYSEVDKEYNQKATNIIREYVPDATIIFCIHSMSSESDKVREREEPKKTSKNRIMWGSITRSHELAFYDENLIPVEVTLDKYI
jgi:hypothetical protein